LKNSDLYAILLVGKKKMRGKNADQDWASHSCDNTRHSMAFPSFCPEP
jgi:hypothetical protein